MEPSATGRKLSAILSADVYGYSRLMGTNEDETFKQLTISREIIFKQIERHRGRVANTAGDAVLADFASVRASVSAALEIQRLIAQENAQIPEERRMRFRIGINLGDVIERGGDLFGDGVNIAARLQALAEPGGICISGSVHEQARHDPEVRFEYLGEQSVKNIAEPVKVFKVLAGAPVQASASTESATEATSAKTRPAEPRGVASAPGGYVVAVLPFDNLSEDPSQSYFGDGLTEDLITGLATIENLKVPARNTMFTYKGRAVNVQQIGRDLGATHAVEGSVRKAGSHVRINVQLIDAKSGNHVWAKRYDNELTDIFDVQDEIVHDIVAELDARLAHGEQARAWRRSTRNAEAYDFFRQAQFAIQHAPTQVNLERAVSQLQKAQSLDSKFVSAFVWEAHAHSVKALFGYEADAVSCMMLAMARADSALALDDASGEAHALKAQLLFFLQQDDQAEKEAQRAFDLDPRFPDTHQVLGLIRSRQKRYEEALSHFHRQNELYGDYWNPYGIRLEAFALIALGRLEEAKSFLAANIARHADLTPLLAYIAAIASAQGLNEEAESVRKELLRRIPNYRNAELGLFQGAGVEKKMLDWFEEHFSAAGIPWIS